MRPRVDQMSRDQLVRCIRELRAEVSRLRARGQGERGLRKIVAELQVHQEELRVQNEALRSAQVSLEESRQRYADLYDFAPIGYVTLDANGVIEEINLTAITLMGMDRTLVLHTPLLVYVAGRDQQTFLEHLKRCRGEESVLVESELHLRDVKGRLVPVRLSSRSEDGADLRRFRTVIMDLTERQATEHERVEQARRQAAAQAASQAKDRFLAVLSHELRTPLTPVLAEVTALEQRADLPHYLHSAMQLIRRNIELEAQLVDDLLDLTRIASGKLRFTPRIVDAHGITNEVRSLIEPEQRGKAQELRLDLRASCHHVRADPMRLRQVLWNLLRNSVRFTPAGGQISVVTRNEPPDQLLISLTDSGIGIAPDALERIFAPFEQTGTGTGGLGLGLTIARGMIEAMGGRIAARSPGVGKGATFEVTLPTSQAAVAQSPAEAPPAAVSRTVRILLVEDHEDTARVMSRLLRTQGHEVRVATSVASAMAVLQQEPQPFEMLISDIGLPDASGLELPGRLADPRMKKIALSGYAADEDAARSRQAGFDEHLCKPLDFRKLIETIARLAAPDKTANSPQKEPQKTGDAAATVG